jgi:hypothetical protein
MTYLTARGLRGDMWYGFGERGPRVDLFVGKTRAAVAAGALCVCVHESGPAGWDGDHELVSPGVAVGCCVNNHVYSGAGNATVRRKHVMVSPQGLEAPFIRRAAFFVR